MRATTAEKRVQTAFRLKPSTIEMAKRRAGAKGMSLNAFVENLLEKDLTISLPKMRRVEIHELEKDPLFVNEGIIPSPTKDMLENDERLAYIWNKGA